MRFPTPTRLAAAAVALIPAVAWATPQPWQIGQQVPATPIMERIHSFHGLLVWIITAIVIFVLALLVYACWRFAEKRNPVPSRRSHHTLLENAQAEADRYADSAALLQALGGGWL